MTHKERVLTTLKREEPDRVPYFEQSVASSVASSILGREAHTGGGKFRRDHAEAAWQGEGALKEFEERLLQDCFDLIRAVDFDIARLPWRGPGKPTKKLDENNYFYENKETGLWSLYTYEAGSDTFFLTDSAIREGGIPAVERQVQAMRRTPEEEMLTPANPFPQLQRLIDEFARERAIGASAGFTAIPLKEAYLEAMTVRPDLIHTYLDVQLEHNLRDIEALAKMDVDIILGGGDFCSNQGPAYSPEHFRSFILPRLKRVTERCHRFGLPYFFRTDGWTWPVAQYLFVESGVDGYGEIDAQAGMDLGELRERLPHLLLWGNVDCGQTLSLGSREDVRLETRACIEKAAAGGGYILGSSNSIHSGVPPDNFLAMIDAVGKFGRY